MIESGFALIIAFLINVSVISVSGAVCNSSNLNPDDQKNCEDLDLNKASFLLKASEPAIPATYTDSLVLILVIAIQILKLL